MSHSRFFILASTFVLPALSAVLLACTAATDPGAHDPASSGALAVGTDGSAPTGAGLAACSNGVRGTANPVTTKTDLAPRVAGRWFFCPQTTTSSFDGHAGIEISAAGQWWFLAADGTRLPGVENGGTWDQDWARDDQPNLIYFRVLGGFIFFDLAFEEGPARIVASGMGSSWQAVPAP